MLLTKPINKLRPKEIDVMALLLFYYISEKPNFKREEDVWKKVFDYETKIEIKDELELPDYIFQNVLSTLRKKKALIGRKIHPNFIPDVNNETKSFKLSYNFIIHDTP